MANNNYIYFNAIKQCMQMLDIRNYRISNQILKNELENMTYQFFLSQKNKLSIIEYCSDNNNRPVIIIFGNGFGNSPSDFKNKLIAQFNLPSDIKTNDGIVDYINMHKEINNRIIFISEDEDYFNVNEASKISMIPDFIEIFYIKTLAIDILNHIYQPKFRLIRSGCSEYIALQKIAHNFQSLPKMCIDDSISKYFNAKIGDIFEIERTSYTGMAKLYRIVVDTSINLPVKKK